MFTIKLFFVSKRYDSLCLFYSKSDNYPIRLFSCETLYRYSRETKKKNTFALGAFILMFVI